MIDYSFNGTRGALRLEEKTDWAEGTLTEQAYFVHGGPMPPAAVHMYGLSPLKANEYLVDAVSKKPIAGGKMLFCFQLASGNDLPANARKSGGVGRLWGFGAHCYVFKAPVGTRYWSTRAVLTTGAEVAFPYIMESGDIVSYWYPSGAKSGGTNFDKEPWNTTVARVMADNVKSIILLRNMNVDLA